MQPNKFLSYSFTLSVCLLTIFVSFFVAYDITGSVWGKIRITQLEPYGGITVDHLFQLELWRAFVSPLIHVKQKHMLYNVLSLFFLGMILEPRIGTIKLFNVWLLSGVVGTLISTLFVEPPWNLGTGGSQAILGVAGYGIIWMIKNRDFSRWHWVVLGFSIIPAFLLDFIFAGYPKPGHLAALAIGALLAAFYFIQLGSMNAHRSAE